MINKSTITLIAICFAILMSLAVTDAEALPLRGYGVGKNGEIYKIVSPSQTRLIKNTNVVFFDIALKTSRTAYAVSNSGYLYQINLHNGWYRRVGFCGYGMNALDFRPGGGLFGMKNSSEFLHVINANNARSRPVMNVDRRSDGDIAFRTRTVFFFTSTYNELVRGDLGTRRTKIIRRMTLGNWYGLDFYQGRLMLVEGNRGLVFRIGTTPGGNKVRVGRLNPNHGNNGVTFY